MDAVDLQESQDEDILELAAEEFPESLQWRADRLWKSWFVLWKAGQVRDAEVEARWGVDGLLQFQAELAAQMVAMRASQQADTQMELNEGEGFLVETQVEPNAEESNLAEASQVDQVEASAGGQGDSTQVVETLVGGDFVEPAAVVPGAVDGAASSS